MAEDRRASTKSPDSGPAARAIRAHIDSAQLALLQAYRSFIAHTEACEPCRSTGVDCDEAAALRRAWRAARGPAAH